MQQQEINDQHFQIFLNQVGGHCILLKADGTDNVLKPVRENEMNFYKYIDQELSETVLTLKKYIPTFYGYQYIQNEYLDQITLDTKTRQQWMDQLIKERFSTKRLLYIQIEDLTAGLQFPCVLDLKMGFTALREKDEFKYDNSTSQVVGFRVCGMKISQPNEYNIFKDKYWGRNLTPIRLTYSLAAFFYDNSTHTINTKLINHFIEELADLHKSIEKNKQIRWRSSSLLLIYNGSQYDQCSLKMIDFAKVLIQDATEPDEAMLAAVQNLIDTLSHVLDIEELSVEQAFK